MVAPRQLERLFDLRTVRRNIRGGLITKERYDEWLKTLPDAADNVATVSFDEEEREARRAAAPRFPVISPTRPLVSAPFDDDDDDDYDDEDEDSDGDAAGEADDADDNDDVAAEPAEPAETETPAGEAAEAGETSNEPETPAGDED